MCVLFITAFGTGCSGTIHLLHGHDERVAGLSYKHRILLVAEVPAGVKKQRAQPCLRGGSGQRRSGYQPPPSFLTGSHMVWQG